MVNPFTPDDAAAGASPDEALRAMGIELSPATQNLYSSSRALIWVNKPNLYENLRRHAASHGIHDTFADSAVINQLLASRNPNDRAIADRLMTESVMRTAQEISGRSDITDITTAFTEAMAPRNNPNRAQQLITQAIDTAGPQDPLYTNMRERYAALLERGANRNDPRLVSLRVNMARVRQEGVNDTPAENQILVNVPAGAMRYDIAGTQGTSRVIIGAGQVGEENKFTPIGEGNVEGITLHQPWRPTNNIARRLGLTDQIPALLASGARHYVAPNGNRFEFDPTLVNNPHVSPFMMLAGPNNPMGAIKVSLGGTFGRNNIYIHDTPDRGNAFRNVAQSSGCMRTENISQLATALTRDPDLGARHGYANNQELFDAARVAIATPIETRAPFNNVRVPIHSGIRVRTVYQTVTWDPQTQRAVIHRDIYGRDQQADRPSQNAMPPLRFERGVVQAVEQSDPTRAPTGLTPRYQT